MGYEIKMFIVEPSHSMMTSEFVEDGNNWFNCLVDDTTIDPRPYHYGKDGNTKTYVDYSNAKINRRYCSVLALGVVKKGCFIVQKVKHAGERMCFLVRAQSDT